MSVQSRGSVFSRLKLKGVIDDLFLKKIWGSLTTEGHLSIFNGMNAL